MSPKIKSSEPAEEIPECPHCGKPMPLCICEGIEPIDNRVELLILQHPQEQDRALGTARLTALQLKKSTLKIGLSWPSLSKALGRDVDPQRWAILYLGSVKLAELETDRDLVAVDGDDLGIGVEIGDLGGAEIEHRPARRVMHGPSQRLGQARP